MKRQKITEALWWLPTAIMVAIFIGANTYPFLKNAYAAISDQTNTNYSKTFVDYFSDKSTLVETGSMAKSSSTDWWLNSGAYFYERNGAGSTIAGELDADDYWRLRYNQNDPTETDNGYHPQNIFRLITKSKWKSYRQEAYFKVKKYILSSDNHRQASNGILLFNRYQDGDNLYYTGLRVDGYAVIKKKINGTYYTMAYKRVYEGIYDRDKNPNLLPSGQWIGLRSEVKNLSDGKVRIRVYADKNGDKNWQLVAEAIDDGKQFGGAAFKNEGYAGIRTDFMDADFDVYSIKEYN